MKISSWKLYISCAIAINLCAGFFMIYYLDSDCECSPYERRYKSYLYGVNEEYIADTKRLNKSFPSYLQSIAIVIIEFESFENDIAETVKCILNVLPAVDIYLISNDIVYPPIQFITGYDQVKLISLKPSLNKPQTFSDPLNFINKEHIFVFPDSIRVENISQISRMLDIHFRKPHSIVAAPIENKDIECLSLKINIRHWTIKYGKKDSEYQCMALKGLHTILLTKTLLMQFAFPFTKPFLTSLYIQATLKKIKTELTDVTFKVGKNLFTDPHHKWKHEVLEQERKRLLYEDFGIKKVIYSPSRVEWYGCNKNTNRCFGTVINNMPEYLFHGRWAPPCCLENLRQTARYVFSILDKCSVRYWLEGGSLLGAVRTGDIIPWDYDVDIGIYKDDINRCEWLKNSLSQSIVDTQGFVWEKAREGDFIRVQFSQTNHLHVDIFPFYSKNGTMTKDTWFSDHPQDMEFPEHYLKPLYKIKFVGVTASAPNNYRAFLELKFGKGAIENPQYPDPNVMKFKIH